MQIGVIPFLFYGIGMGYKSGFNFLRLQRQVCNVINFCSHRVSKTI
uniref:Uncharacterized protein n=1 Tax=Rhizophora mucronata TaxID=61149 RepID=A0A2P2J0G1_RHIMU